MRLLSSNLEALKRTGTGGQSIVGEIWEPGWIRTCNRRIAALQASQVDGYPSMEV